MPESNAIGENARKIRQIRGSIGGDKSRGKPDDDPSVVQKYQDLHALQIERAVLVTLDRANRPTDEQLARIAALLQAGGAA